MGYDAASGQPPQYGPSRTWWLVGFCWVLFAHFTYTIGMFPVDVVARLHESSAPWSNHVPWAGLILLKNVLLVAAWYGTWHYFLYVRRVVPKERKFNKEWETGYCYDRDVRLCISGAFINSCYEMLQVYLFASRAVEYDDTPLLHRPVRNLFCVAFCFYWSDVHFWFAHRVMHPWLSVKTPFDPGAFLYRSVHSVHHKSHNPGPWSGLAMHPLEHIIYFTRAIGAVMLSPIPLHPTHFLMLHTRAMLGPVFGHHGFSGYLGYKFHYLHHAKFEVNYGTSCVVPIDNVLGTYSLGGAADRWKADKSLNAWIWVFGVPYLVPLAALAFVTGM